MYRYIYILVSCFLSPMAWGQFTYSSPLPAIAHTGYAKVSLSPEIVAVSQSGLADLRICDEQGHPVPYFVVYSNPETIVSVHKMVLHEVMRAHTKAKWSEYIVKNVEKKNINHFVLNISNTNAVKRYHLLGSNDMKSWYAIQSDDVLDNMVDNTKTTMDKTISIPNTNYFYYKFEINDSTSAPIIIHQISSYFSTSSHSTDLKTLNDIAIQYQVSGNDNVIHVKSPYPYDIDAISIRLDDNNLFRRPFVITAREQYKKKWRDVELYSGIVEHQEYTFHNLHIKQNEFQIRILNKDNPKLHISEVICYQYPIYIVTFLDSSRRYHILTGNHALSAPDYDIGEFRDRIPKELPMYSCGELIHNKEKHGLSSTHFYQKKWFMWICIVIGAGVVFLFSLQIIRQLNIDKNV